jgi:ribonucleotide monophosphatase NagD (HAD superfamily)
MISDDPFSDLVGAKKLGMKTAFVLSGKYRDKDILNEMDKDIYPDFVFDNITQIEICK